MPIYDFKCTKCNEIEEAITHFCTKFLDCHCGGQKERLMTINNCVYIGLPTQKYHRSVKRSRTIEEITQAD